MKIYYLLCVLSKIGLLVSSMVMVFLVLLISFVVEGFVFFEEIIIMVCKCVESL